METTINNLLSKAEFVTSHTYQSALHYNYISGWIQTVISVIILVVLLIGVTSLIITAYKNINTETGAVCGMISVFLLIIFIIMLVPLINGICAILCPDYYAAMDILKK